MRCKKFFHFIYTKNNTSYTAISTGLQCITKRYSLVCSVNLPYLVRLSENGTNLKTKLLFASQVHRKFTVVYLCHQQHLTVLCRALVTFSTQSSLSKQCGKEITKRIPLRQRSLIGNFFDVLVSK